VTEPGEDALDAAVAVDEAELWKRFADGADESALGELTNRYLPLARRLAARYQAPSREREDLDQVASLALVQAIERFDPARGPRFASFAIPTILGELRRHFREHAWAVRVPRSLKENAAAVRLAIERLAATTGRQPTVKELAEESRLSMEQVLDALEATSASDPESLDAGAPESGLSLGEKLGGEDPAFELAEYAAAVAPALREMDDRDRKILHLRFVEDLTQSEIATRLDLSQMHVSRLLRRAVATLRDAADDDLARPEDG
jgi:RNA polymerase sigma-B factor